MYLPDGLLTSGFIKHDEANNPHIIAPDPFASDDCLDVPSPANQFPPLEPTELNTMNPSEDEPSSGLNGRLRPRKSAIPSPPSIKQIAQKFDGKHAQEKPKRSCTPSKASPSTPEDLSTTNSNLLPTPQLLCPYCDRKFGSRQSVLKHIRRLHLSVSKIDSSIVCLFCNHYESEPSDIIRHMIDSHPNQYFACLDCHTRFPSTKELAEHKLNICEKQKIPYHNKLRQKATKKTQKSLESHDKDEYTTKTFSRHGYNGVVISCELKPAHIHNEADIEDNITTNLILPPRKNISPSAVLDKNAVIVLDDIQWNRRIPSNFSFHNTDADQILSRLGVVHRSPKTGESTKKDLFKAIEDATQKFEKCFDTGFYSKVASNVQENLARFLDGSFNFNPDPNTTIKTRKSKNSVIINTAEGFPILLALEQYSRHSYDGFIPRTIAPKYKWKWDNLESEKPWNPDQIKRDTHANNCIITLVSSLDIWTQLRMRHKFEEKFNITPVEKKTEKQNVISDELKEILESRDIPASNSQIVKYVNTTVPVTNEQEFPAFLGLMPSSPECNVKPAILSGEWVRPRCYVCCACGAQSRDSRALSIHVSSEHPNAQVQHYEIVGESLLKADILRHLYVPPNQHVNRTRPPRGFRDCTKCMQSITNEDLHQHMLDCAGDMPAVRRKCRYRPFGVRKRRPRVPDNRIRKKMRNDIRTRPSRQKGRMRPKQKHRSEVGDAETIRKMLADLPAKRHRVLVNPLNPILRPRRKLNKQRAMFMMKRHTSDDLKSAKPKPSGHYDHQKIPPNIDRYKNGPNKSDEDNEPLKPRLKRMTCSITRQKEVFNRKGLLKRPKRKIRLPTENNETDDNEDEPDTSMPGPNKIQNNELSIDNNEQRVNLNQDPQNTREHSSGRGDSNNDQRDNQRPGGGSEQNGNSRNIPVQNVPLKHSIARLTANSETHDKSVQFHHLFLVQQECNNTNEHVPTGQRMLFENEAVVTKLDKPPLHFLQNISLESAQENNADPVLENNLEVIHGQTLDSAQKNKLNKPRKGLNDCIAMLKNKLVDTDVNEPAHVSVQCGTDDLLGPDPILINTSTLVSPKVDAVMKSVQAYPNRQQPKKYSSKSLARNEHLPKPAPLYHGQYFNHDMYAHVSNERPTTQWRPVNYDAIMPRYIDNHTRKESSRRRSVSHHENIFFAQRLLNVTPPNDDMLIRLSSDSYNPYNLPARKNPKNVIEQFNVDSNKMMSKLGKRINKSPGEASNGSLQNYGRNVNIHTENRNFLDSSKKSTRTRISTPRKPVETLEKQVNIRKDLPKSTKDANEKYRKKALDFQPQRNLPINTSGERNVENYPQVIKRKGPSNVNTEASLSHLKQVELQSKPDFNVKMPINVFTEHNLIENQVSIPLAHASTNVESMLPVPLDLSNKALSIGSNYSSRNDPKLLINYDKDETLDLSNKRKTSMEHVNEDEVVDLRVKHNIDYLRLPALQPHCSSTSQQNRSSVAALNLTQHNECVPTDLSLKRRGEDTNICINLSQKINICETQIQDLSQSKMKTISSGGHLQLDAELPTDLSMKNDANIENISPTIKESTRNDGNESVLKCNGLNEQDRPNDLSEKLNDKQSNSSNIQTLSTDNHVTGEQCNTKTLENIEHDTPETSISNSTLTQPQKPIYDPTLRIPQYKIRPKNIEFKANEAIVTVTPSLTAISTCIDSYSPRQMSINNTHSTSRPQHSTIITNSMIASIEAQERITYSFTKSMLNTVVTSITGSLPSYSLLNRGMTTTPFTTFESTRPVYALPNACISMAKIDVTTNSLLSIPSTTIMSTSPVYTLAGTTIGTPLNYLTLPSTGQPIPYPPPCGTYLPEIDSHPRSANIQKGRIYENNISIRGPKFSLERKHEISKKIVTLPKDIVAILKTMPIQHRNQLLDVLSRYLSVSRPVPILTTQTSLLQNSRRPSILTMPIRLSKESKVNASTGTVDTNSLSNSVYSSVQRVVLHNEVIDLTYDDIVPKTDIDAQMTVEPQILSTEGVPAAIAPMSHIQKTNNDKTASLRAVRIKAPSERQQLKMISNPVESLSFPDIPGIPNNDNFDSEIHKSLHADAPSIIQMYEVSSTQSKNKLPQHPDSNVVKSKNEVLVKRRCEEVQLKSLNTNLIGSISSENSVNYHENKDLSRATENTILKNNIDVNSSLDHQLNETNKNSINITMSNIQEPLVTYNLNKPENDDDSEDDISLAVIVKQKQQNQNKFKVSQFNNKINKSKSDIESHKKNKSINKLDNEQAKQTDKSIALKTLIVKDLKKAINNKAEVELTIADTVNVNQNIAERPLGVGKLQHIAEDNSNVKRKQVKKKDRKIHNDGSLLRQAKKQDKKEIKMIEQETDTRTERDHLCESVKNSKEHNLKLRAKAHDITLVGTDVETINAASTRELIDPENVEKPKKSINKKCVSIMLEEPKEIVANEIKTNVLDLATKEENKNLRNVTHNVTFLVDTYNHEQIHDVHKPSTVEESSLKQNSIVEEVHLASENRNLLINNNSVSNEAKMISNEEEIGLPLRRSKRGKSLFVDGNEQGLIFSDTYLEPKAPLTKKQLIFSKLLLDEEKNLKISATDEANQIISAENNSYLQANLQKSSKEKSKSLKRKKSPHSKKKSKKKRSTDNSEPVVSDDNVTKVIVKENHYTDSYCDSQLNAEESYIVSNPDLCSKLEFGSQVPESQKKFGNNNELASEGIENIAKENKISLPDSIVKRKIEPAIDNSVENSIHSSKPKKSKLDTVNDILVTLHSETESHEKNDNISNENLSVAVRRARSKSVVVKSSVPMLYDPYDIDLEDMGDKKEPFRNQRLILLRTGNCKLSKEDDVQTPNTNINVASIDQEMNLNAYASEATATKDPKEVLCDSDDSSKSDVPLKKYVEERERKNLLCVASNTKHPDQNNESLSNDNEPKKSRKRHKKSKRSPAAIDNLQKHDKVDTEVSEEQLRSEQFMESFGFFSERKPRKSNLLASKKISETFHMIANESDDIYMNTKQRPSKKSSRSENKKTVEDNNTKECKSSDAPKLSTKNDKDVKLRSATLYCHICKKEFRRTDNLVRHQMTLSHAAKLSEITMKLRFTIVPDEFNYLVVFKQHIDRIRMLEQNMKSNNPPKTKFTLPSLRQVLVDVRKAVREQQLARRNLSRDQALFLDCCQLLNDSNRGQLEDRNVARPFFRCCPTSYALACTSTKEYDPQSGLSLEFSRYGKRAPETSNLPKKPIIHTSARLSGMLDFMTFLSIYKQTSCTDPFSQPSTSTAGLDQCFNNFNFTQMSKVGILEKIADEKDESKSDGDVDSITAQNILESEEVRNLENDLISGLKEAACKFKPLLSGDKFSPVHVPDSCPQAEIDISVQKDTTSKVTNIPDTKEKKNLDIIENIDIFEDKFDKIKRKCRSQAAAAKLVQTSVEPSTSNKSRKKSDKKKGKRNSKKYNQNTVLTKGALKGYDSIKVSILTSDINMSAIVPPIVASTKKKKKRSSKKKRDRKKSMLTSKLDSNGSKESSHKTIDVYEFLDNEESEIFGLRRTTVMERFRNLNKKEVKGSAKITPDREEVVSSDSVSDGDDFVYMSDDYVCSDDETENSLMSYEFGNVKGSNEVKKSFSPLKRKDVMEKNAVMGKIFKHNAVRSEKKNVKPKETAKPKANLDQLFDSLLEEEPNSSVLMNDTDSPEKDRCVPQKKRVFSPIVLSKYDLKTTKNVEYSSKKNRSPSPALSSDSAVSRRNSSFSSRQSSPRRLSSSRYDIESSFDYEPSTSKRYDDSKKYDRITKDYELTKKYDTLTENTYEISIPNSMKMNDDLDFSPKSDKTPYNIDDKTTKSTAQSTKREKAAHYGTSYDYKADYYDEDVFSDDAGVARQRVRRKCTVGKQNILAETWSSESELDSVPPRPNSAESVVLGVVRKRKGRKRDTQICGGRKGNKHVSVKKRDFESRVSSSNRNTGSISSVAGTSRSSGGSTAYTQQLSLPGPSGIGPRLRPSTSFWADGDEEPEHIQQHGWIVGDSHKKLVTMLAHAKGRKRNNDDKVRLME